MAEWYWWVIGAVGIVALFIVGWFVVGFALLWLLQLFSIGPGPQDFWLNVLVGLALSVVGGVFRTTVSKGD